MSGRVQALTDLEFDLEAIKESVRPNVDGDVYDSTAGFWLISRHYPHIRTILSPDAIHHGPIRDSLDPEEEQINERVHWSVLKKRGRPCGVFGVPNTAYNPPNLPATIPLDKIAAITPEELALSPQVLPGDANAQRTRSEPRPNQLAFGEDHETSNKEQKDRDS